MSSGTNSLNRGGLRGGFGGQDRGSSLQTIVIGGLFLALLLLSLFMSQANQPRPYDLESSAPDGLLALSVWLEEMGYTVARQESDLDGTASTFAGPTADGRTADLFFVYPNLVRYSESEADGLRQWVEEGGTLVLIGPSQGDLELIRTFGVSPDGAAGSFMPLESLSQPLVPWPSLTNFADNGLQSLNLSDAPGAVPVVVDNRSNTTDLQPQTSATVAVQPLGAGIVWHLSTSHPLTNQMLEQNADRYLVPALLRRVPAGGTVIFDTAHLRDRRVGGESGEFRSLQAWLYGTNPGRGILLAALLSFLYLINQGLRLGPALPMRETLLRREAAEYVVAMAGLQRRVGEPTEVARYHRHRLKQKIGKPLGIASDLADDEFIRLWQHHRPNLSPALVNTVTEILTRLSLRLDERTLVETIARIEDLDL